MAFKIQPFQYISLVSLCIIQWSHLINGKLWTLVCFCLVFTCTFMVKKKLSFHLLTWNPLKSTVGKLRNLPVKYTRATEASTCNYLLLKGSIMIAYDFLCHWWVIFCSKPVLFQVLLLLSLHLEKVHSLYALFFFLRLCCRISDARTCAITMSEPKWVLSFTSLASYLCQHYTECIQALHINHHSSKSTGIQFMISFLFFVSLHGLLSFCVTCGYCGHFIFSPHSFFFCSFFFFPCSLLWPNSQWGKSIRRAKLIQCGCLLLRTAYF